MKARTSQAAQVKLSPEIPFPDQNFDAPESSFECQDIIAQYHAEKAKWLANPAYWLVYWDICGKQSEAVQLAENLRMLALSSTPEDRRHNSAFKTQITAFAEKHSKALDKVTFQQDIAYPCALVKANTLRQESIEWKFSLPDQISLGIIYLREYRQRPHTQTKDTVELRTLIKDWQKAHGETNASSNAQWNRAFTCLPVTRLLSPQSLT